MNSNPTNIAILGSTGSIGVNTLKVAALHPERFKVVGLVAGENVELLSKQMAQFQPERVSVKTEEAAQELKPLLKQAREILVGQDGAEKIASHENVDMVVSAMSGAVGLVPTLRAIEAGKNIALANKEVLVMAGSLVMKSAGEHRARIVPVDSEHSAIFQALEGQKRDEIRRLILCASGGPFIDMDQGELDKVTPEQALDHPRWKMGPKNSIDSASMINKTLEVIEAHWLFDIPPDRIDVIIHPQSVIHSMVEFIDGSILAQMSVTDMRLPIAYALGYPNRIDPGTEKLHLKDLEGLTFKEVDAKRFPAVNLGYKALEQGGTMPAVMNAANELAVGAFLEQALPFNRIIELVQKVMEQHRPGPADNLEQVSTADAWARQKTLELI